MGAQENIKVVQGAYEAFENDDIPGVFSRLAEDVLWVNYEDNPFGGTYRGHDEVMQYLGNLELLDLTKFEVDKILGDDDTVVSLLTIGYTVKATGKSFEGPTVHIFTVDGDKITGCHEVAAGSADIWES